MTFLQSFNNHEIALFIWSILALFLLLFNTSLRNGLRGLLEILFSRKIIGMWLLMIFYMGSWICVLIHLKLWDINLLKDTLMWLFFAGSVALLNAHKIDDNPQYFKKALKDNIKLTLLFEFLNSEFAFSLWIELLVIPFSVLIAVMLVATEIEEKYLKIKTLLNRILILIGLIVVYHLVRETIANFEALLTVEKLKSLLLAPVLSLLFLPYLYLLSLRMTYEIQLIIMRRAIKKKELLSYAERNAIIRFNIDTKALKYWVRRLWVENIETREDVRISISGIKKQLALVEKPMVVPVELGWSPFIAAKFMTAENLVPGFYNPEYAGSNDWFACSPRQSIDGYGLNYTLAYYIGGTQTVVNKIDLELKVLSPRLDNELQTIFITHTRTLFKRVSNDLLPETICKALLNLESGSVKHDHLNLTVKKEDWGNSTNGYDLVFTIAV